MDVAATKEAQLLTSSLQKKARKDKLFSSTFLLPTPHTTLETFPVLMHHANSKSAGLFSNQL